MTAYANLCKETVASMETCFSIDRTSRRRHFALVDVDKDSEAAEAMDVDEDDVADSAVPDSAVDVPDSAVDEDAVLPVCAPSPCKRQRR